jgi:hypothetical protein
MHLCTQELLMNNKMILRHTGQQSLAFIWYSFGNEL